MKHFLAAATVAVLLAAAPAGAQVAYGVATAPGEFGQPSADGTWRGNVVIYSTVDPVAAATGVVSAASASSAPASVTSNIAAPAAASNAGGSAVTAQAGVIPVNVAVVPEPATWAMMLIGFGAVGTVLRTRRKATLRFA